MDDELVRLKFKDDVKISQTWLTSQRNRLMGAIDQLDDRSWWIKFTDYLLLSNRYRLVLQTGILFLVLIAGYMAGISNLKSGESPDRLADLIKEGRIGSVELIKSDPPSANLSFVLTEENQIHYSGPKNDNTTLQLLYYTLEHTTNSGERLDLANYIANAGLSSNLALSTVSKALRDENNLAVQFALLSGLEDQEKPIVKETILGVALGDYPIPLRLAAMKKLIKFAADDYICGIMRIVATADPNSSIRYAAQKILEKNFIKGGEIAK